MRLRLLALGLLAGAALPAASAQVVLELPPPPPAPITLSTFGGEPGGGSIRPGSTWVGNVTPGAGYITIGGNARDDNGWGATGLNLNLTGMNTLTITAQRDPGHATSSLFLQIDARDLTAHYFAVSSSLFAVGTPTQVQIVIGVWSSDFDFTQITSWSIGGGGLGVDNFRMTLSEVGFSASAIPEPSTYAAWAGMATLACAFWRRRRRKA